MSALPITAEVTTVVAQATVAHHPVLVEVGGQLVVAATILQPVVAVQAEQIVAQASYEPAISATLEVLGIQGPSADEVAEIGDLTLIFDNHLI